MKRNAVLYSIVAAIAFVILLLTISLVKQNQENRGQALTVGNDTTLVVTLNQDPATGQIDIESVIAIKSQNINASSSQDTRKSDPNHNHFTHQLEVVNHNSTISVKKFYLQEYLLGVPPQPGTKEKLGDPPSKLDHPFAVVEIPYIPDSTLYIRNIQTGDRQSLSSAKIAPALTRAKIIPSMLPATVVRGIKQPVNNDDYFDILFISSHYTNFDQYASDVTAISNFLLSITPYSNLVNNIRIIRLDNSQDLGCYYSGRLIICNPSLVHSVAAQVPHDAVIVIENNTTYGGSGYLGDFAVTYRDISAWAKQVATHEAGHSIGWLWDEYDYGSSYSYTYTPWDNCSYSNPCKWNGNPGTGCYAVCGYQNLYRPTSSSCLMRDIQPSGGPHFDYVCEAAIYSAIDSYLYHPVSCPNRTRLNILSPCYTNSGPGRVEITYDLSSVTDTYISNAYIAGKKSHSGDGWFLLGKDGSPCSGNNFTYQTDVIRPGSTEVEWIDFGSFLSNYHGFTRIAADTNTAFGPDHNLYVCSRTSVPYCGDSIVAGREECDPPGTACQKNNNWGICNSQCLCPISPSPTPISTGFPTPTPILNWQIGPTLPNTLHRHFLAMAGERLYNIGGLHSGLKTQQVYTNTFDNNGNMGLWTTTTSIPYPRSSRVGAIHGNHIYLLDNIGSGALSILMSTINADGSLSAWSNINPLNYYSTFAATAVTLSITNKFYMLGGRYQNGTLNSNIDMANIESDGLLTNWTFAGSLPKPLYNHAAIVVGTYIYLLGGGSQTGFEKAVYSAPINTTGTIGTWTTQPSLPVPLIEFTIVAKYGYLYAIGGQSCQTGCPALDTVYFAPILPNGSLGNWSVNSHLPIGLTAHQAVSKNDCIFITGGWNEVSQSSVYFSCSPMPTNTPIPTNTSIPSPFPACSHCGLVPPSQIQPACQKKCGNLVCSSYPRSCCVSGKCNTNCYSVTCNRPPDD